MYQSTQHLGRQFIVEMQMVWSAEFKQRVLFNASKAYVKQLNRGEDYSLLKPVYSLNLVNEVFEPELDDYYHYYHLVHEEHTEKVIDGLHLVFVELPKFTPHTFTEKKMQVLWLRYLTEINEKTKEVPAELLANPEIAKAVSEIEESAYTEEELLGYDEFWDMVSVEKTLAGRLERLTKANDVSMPSAMMIALNSSAITTVLSFHRHSAACRTRRRFSLCRAASSFTTASPTVWRWRVWACR